MTDLKDFLENIRKYSPKMGEIAMRHTAEQLEMDIGGGRQQSDGQVLLYYWDAIFPINLEFSEGFADS